MQPRSIRIGTHVTTKTEGTHCPESAGYTAILKSLGRDAFVLNLLESLINFFAVCLRTHKNLLFELGCASCRNFSTLSRPISRIDIHDVAPVLLTGNSFSSYLDFSMKNSFVNIYSFLFPFSPLPLFFIIIITIIIISSRVKFSRLQRKVYVRCLRAFKEVEFFRGNFRKEVIFVSLSLSLSFEANVQLGFLVRVVRNRSTKFQVPTKLERSSRYDFADLHNP